MFLSFFLFSFFFGAAGYAIIVQFLRKYLSKENFRGRKVPVGSGLVLVVTFLCAIAFYVVFSEKQVVEFSDWLRPLMILISAMGILGFIDDMFGSRDVGGFKGHLRELFRGRVTTGIIKAAGGGIVCLVIARFFSMNLFALMANGLLMALFANIFNLLDLRPGRALKVFLILGIVIFVFSFRNPFWSLSAIFLGVYIILLWADLSESCMLGDVGSNILGATIGFCFVVNFSWLVNLAALILLSLVHIYAEGHSITELIENTPVLRNLDELGRLKDRRALRRREKIV